MIRPRGNHMCMSQQYVGAFDSNRFLSFASLFSTSAAVSPTSPLLLHVLVLMGRRPWATPEQTEFLLSHTSNLEREKNGAGLEPYYNRVFKEFIAKWPVSPTEDELKEENPQSSAEDRRKNVRLRVFPMTER